MLQIKDMSITCKKDLRTLVTGLSFVLNPGDKMALIGEEGNGKSTLMKLIYDESLVTDYVEYSGQIIRNGFLCGYLKQELDDSEKELSIYDFLACEPAFYDMGTNELANLAKQVGLPPDLLYSDQSVKTLSGGERVKLQMTRILCHKPDILLLDEPSNDIDIRTLSWLERQITDWDGAVLFISHDETLLERTANRILHLELIRRKTQARHTIQTIGYAEYVERRSHELQKQEQLARKERSEYRAQQERLRQIEQKVAHRQETISRQDPHGARLLKKKMKAVKSLERRFERESSDRTEIPDVEEAILFKFHGTETLPAGKTVLSLELDELQAGGRLLAQKIHLEVRGPEKICITGRNGAGKTTLLKQLAGQLLDRTDLRAAYMPQDYEDEMDFESTPAAFLSRTGDKDEVTKIRTFLGSMKYTADEMDHPLGELSGGQKAKLFLLRMSMHGANVLILDEPTRNLSPLSNPVIRQLLKNYTGAIISVSHDRKYISEVCDTVYELTESGLALIRG